MPIGNSVNLWFRELRRDIVEGPIGAAPVARSHPPQVRPSAYTVNSLTVNTYESLFYLARKQSPG
jgi:hypothetical protein